MSHDSYQIRSPHSCTFYVDPVRSNPHWKTVTPALSRGECYLGKGLSQTLARDSSRGQRFECPPYIFLNVFLADPKFETAEEAIRSYNTVQSQQETGLIWSQLCHCSLLISDPVSCSVMWWFRYLYQVWGLPSQCLALLTEYMLWSSGVHSPPTPFAVPSQDRRTTLDGGGGAATVCSKVKSLAVSQWLRPECVSHLCRQATGAHPWAIWQSCLAGA